MQKYMTYCGLYCGACSSMLLHDQSQGEPNLPTSDIDPEETACPGCCSPGLENCEFVACNLAHGTESCAFCPEFPCAMITNFQTDEWAHHIVVLDNLKRIKAIGIEAWLEEQKKYWTCKQCGNRTHWYQTECQNCGHTWEPLFPKQ